MQLSLALDPKPPVAEVHRRLRSAFGGFTDAVPLSPLDQLIRALIAAQAGEELAWPAWLRLKARFGCGDDLMLADPADVAAVIAPVPHADLKAGWLVQAPAKILALTGDLSLQQLATDAPEAAMAWLKTHIAGAGDRVAAQVLNFSSLRRPVMVVDAHVWRVARRLGLAPRAATPEATRLAIEAAAPAGWTGDEAFDLHWLLKRLGQTLCQEPRTRCGACPLAGLCEARRQAAFHPPRAGAVVALVRAAPEGGK